MPRLKSFCLHACLLACVFFLPEVVHAQWSLVMTNGYGDVYRMNMLRDRANYQAYRGVCSYRGFSLSGCSTTGEVVMLRIKATPNMPEHFSLLSTSLRWGTTMYVLNDVFRPINSSVMSGYENWYPFDMSCSVAMYIHSGGFSAHGGFVLEDEQEEYEFDVSDVRWENTEFDAQQTIAEILAEPQPRVDSYSLVLTNGYGDVYRMNMLRDRANYQAYRGVVSYRGFSLSGCSTTGEVVMLRIKETPTMPEHFSLVSTSLRWGTTMYFLNDVFRPISPSVMAGYENWYPFDMSCSVAFYVHSGGFGAHGMEVSSLAMEWPAEPLDRNPNTKKSDNVMRVGALVPLHGDLEDIGSSYIAAYGMAMSEITNTPGMESFELMVKDTDADPTVAMMRLMELYDEGIQIVVGPESSAECEIVLDYANNHGMVLLSSSATAASLAIENDNLMRFFANDSFQAVSLAQGIFADGITHLAILARTDTYGSGFKADFIQEYSDQGGHVFFSNYYPRIPEFLPEVVSNMAQAVAAHVEGVDADHVGVLMVSFDEGMIILEAADAWPVLTAVRWYGTDGMAGNANVLTNSVANEVARRTQFVCSSPAAFTNAKYAEVSAAISAETGHAQPRTFAVIAYDSLWLAAKALLDTEGTGTVTQVRESVRTQAATYTGASGPIHFNAADDRADGEYTFVKVSDANAWVDIFATVPDAPVARTATHMTATGFTARWAGSAGATDYMLDVATNTNFSLEDCVPGYHDASVGNALSHELADLPMGGIYYYRVRAANAAGDSPSSDPAEVDLYRLDSDGDGVPDWAELIAGTDPYDSNSVFRAEGIPAAGHVALQSVTGRIYHLHYTTNLMQPHWLPVPGATNIPGIGGMLVLTNMPAADVQRTYRIAVEEAP